MNLQVLRQLIKFMNILEIPLVVVKLIIVVVPVNMKSDLAFVPVKVPRAQLVLLALQHVALNVKIHLVHHIVDINIQQVLVLKEKNVGILRRKNHKTKNNNTQDNFTVGINNFQINLNKPNIVKINFNILKSKN